MPNVSNVVKTIQDIMRKDAGTYGDAQRLEQLGWMFFLKIFDDREKEMAIVRDAYKGKYILGDISLLFGVPTDSFDGSGPIPLADLPDLDDDTVATDFQLRALGKIVSEDTLLWFRDIRDGGGVGRPYGEGPFGPDDELAVYRSWRDCGLPGQMTLSEWAILREEMWRVCAPWSEGLFNLFGAVQEELLSQWRALPPDSHAHELKLNDPSFGLEKIVVKRSGPKAKARSTVLREILSKQPELPCKAVCRLMDSKFATNQSRYPTLARPEFGGRTYDSWEQAYSDQSARNLVESLISRCRRKAT